MTRDIFDIYTFILSLCVYECAARHPRYTHTETIFDERARTPEKEEEEEKGIRARYGRVAREGKEYKEEK